jgi:hypothetical protein
VPYYWPDDDGFGDSRGWDRTSIAMNTRHEYRPDVGQRDLLMPKAVGSGHAFLLCCVAGLCLTFLCVALPLFLVNIFVPLGRWFGIVLAVSLVGLPLALFAFSKYEDKELRQLARDL